MTSKRKAWLQLTFLCLPFSLGFRIFPGGNLWRVSATDPTIWIRSCREPRFESAHFSANDPLVSIGIPTYRQAMQSIIDDYNSVPGSFLRLAIYPDDPANPPSTVAGDSSFSAAAAANRTIEICFEDQTFTAGHARPTFDDSGRVNGCTIRLNDDIFDRAQDVVGTLTHEIGHCLGLDHPQETDDSVMSYFGRAIRLQIDDKMGLTHLYPRDQSQSREQPSFGLSCSPR